MSNDLNQCNFIGRLGRDPETRFLSNGDACVNFSIAVGESWKSKDGEKIEKTEWVRCVAWRKLAEICGEYLKKGSQVYIGGKMQTRKYDKDGQEHYAVEIVVDRMQMLGSKQDGHHADGIVPAKSAASARPHTAFADGFPEDSDSIPF